MAKAGCELRIALASGPKIRTVRIILDPNDREMGPWLSSARACTPELRGIMVQGFFAHIFRMAGYDVIVGKELDVCAKNQQRSMLVEVKSSLNGAGFGSHVEIAQLEGYLVVSERRRAETWLAVMGLNKPVRLRDGFKSELRIRNIGLIDVRWISPEDTLMPYLSSVGQCHAAG
jgi:hypothetical protein